MADAASQNAGRFRTAAMLGLLVLCAALTGCGSAWRPRTPEAAPQLPAEPLPTRAIELVRLSNRLLQQPPDDARLDRALAAAREATRRRPGYATWWRLARASLLVAQRHSRPQARRTAAAEGIVAAQQAIAAAPERVGGYHFLAACTGTAIQLDTDGALERIQEIETNAQKARTLDAGFQQGGPLRVLAAMYANAPSWPTSIGDIEEALEIFKELVASYGDYGENHFHYAESLMKVSDYENAAAQYRAVLASPARGVWRLLGPGYRLAARQRLSDIDRLRALQAP